MAIQIPEDAYVLLWSPHQKHFHIEPFEKMLATNRRIFSQDTLGDYILLAITETAQEANQLADKLTPQTEGRQPPVVIPQ